MTPDPEPLLLIPGILCDARVFIHQVVALSLGRVVGVTVPVQPTVEEMARVALAGAPPRFALAGLGLGANVALEMQRRAPERIARIALMGMSPLADPPALSAAREHRIVGARAGRLMQMAREEYPEASMGPDSDPGALQALIEDMADVLGEGVFIAQSRAAQRRPDQQRALRSVLVPALVLCGEQDTLHPPRRHEFVAEMLPYGRLEVVEGAGHLAPFEAPDAVNAALADWLGRPPQTR